MDAFLVSTEELDELAEAGRFQRHVCRACGSRDIDDIGAHVIQGQCLRGARAAPFPAMKR